MAHPGGAYRHADIHISEESCGPPGGGTKRKGAVDCDFSTRDLAILGLRGGQAPGFPGPERSELPIYIAGGDIEGLQLEEPADVANRVRYLGHAGDYVFLLGADHETVVVVNYSRIKSLELRYHKE